MGNAWAPAGHADAPAREGSSGRRFGELLVEENVITAEQLEATLRLQAVSTTYRPIGQVLLASKLVTRKQLLALLQRHKKRSRLGDILVRAGIVTAAQLDEALTHQRQTGLPIGQALITLGHVGEMALRDALCTQLHVNLFHIDPIAIDPGLARLISERFATRHGLVPLFRAGEIVVVAIDDPTRVALLEQLQLNLGIRLEVVTAPTGQIERAGHRLYRGGAAPAVDVFQRPSILIGPIRDHFVIELATRHLPGVLVLPTGWQ